VLLPAEVELCETVGLTEDEYFYFIELTQAYNGKRPKEYDEIPYVVNGFVGGFIAKALAGNITAQLVLGIVLTVVSVLLTPKPRAPKTPPSLTTAGITGPKRFAPQTGFNSVQELARLGEVVPLIFTKQETETNGGETKTYGGVRVNTRLLWSQMLSFGSGQQLKALFMIGLGDLAHKPDFAGFAIGDLLLKNYFNKKLAIYASPRGGRPQEGLERYPEGTLEREKDRRGGTFQDIMSVDWDQTAVPEKTITSSARTPNTQTIFGNYSPVPNSMRYRVPYELVLKQKNLKDQNKTDVDTKRRKLRTNFPRYTAVYRYNGDEANKTSFYAEKDARIDYIIGDMDTESQYGDSFNPWGVEDVKSAVDASREETDDAIQKGESYLIGEALAVCQDKSNPIWSSGTYQTCFFTIDTGGLIDVRGGQPGFFHAHGPAELLTIQKVALGTISNSKACDVTEIGLKSKVFKQVTSFPNVNSHPGAVGTNTVDADTTDGVVKRYNDDDGSISLGGMSKYLTRYSFFRLQAREAGIDGLEDSWRFIDEGKPFGIRGNSPQPQYNFIRINHYSVPKKEFEFRFVPYPGNLIRRAFVDQRPVRMLSASGPLLNYNSKPNDQLFSIFFQGSEETLREGDVSNTEWYLGDLPTDTDGGKVKSLKQNLDGYIPVSTRWVEIDRRTPSESDLTSGRQTAKIHLQSTEGSFWQWGNQKNYPFWNEYINNKNRAVNDPLKQGSSITVGNPYKQPYIDRDGFRFGVGPFVVEQPRNRQPLAKGIYYGMIKYEMKEAEVPPTVRQVDVTGGSGSGLKVNVKVYRKPDTNEYAGATWEVVEGERGRNYKDSDKVSIPAIPDLGFPGVNNIHIVTDFSDFVTSPWPEGRNLNPFDAVADYYQYDSERSSHQDGPEHEIVYVNEQSNLGRDIPYAFNQAGIANVALRLASSKEWNSFSQFSAYIKEGILVQRLVEDKIGPTNLFPEIVYALLTEDRFGLADSIGASAVDKDRMTVAAKFCEANGFYWDGVITDKQNIREFVYQNAVFNLLDFTILGGKFSLFPSVPFGSDFVIKRDKVIKEEIRALFTDGNTRNLKVSFLSPEERQNFIGTVYFRKEIPNGFSETLSKTFTISTDDENLVREKFPIEVFDMSDFCTNENHAVEFIKHALMIRKTVDHGIKFETTPQAALGLQPGNYIRFISEATHTSRFENGVISPDGLVQSVGNSTLSNTPIYYWKPGTQEVLEAKLTVIANGTTTNSNLFGAVFTVKQTSESNRLYKIESITYTDEGFIEVSASHAPLLSDGTLATINYDDDFTSI